MVRLFGGRLRRKHVFWLAIAAALAGALWFWPARRNYYAKLGEVERRLDIPYVTGQAGPKQRLDLYLPERATKPFPIVVFVHGGYWSPLDRRWLEPLIGTFGNVGVALARQGVAAAIVGYRQYPEVTRGADSLDDIASAVRFVHDSCAGWGCGPLFVVGHSAGGHLASLLALDGRILARHGVEADAVAGFVSFDGIFDLKASMSAFTPDQAAIMRRLFGPDDARLAAYSTVTYARARHPPLLVIDTTGDATVCRDAFQRFKARSLEVGSPARFVELPGLGHNEGIVRLGMDDDPVLPALLDFIRGAK